MISIIIICYNMRREVPRTIASFLPPYQRSIDPGEVEILVVDNGSKDPIERAVRDSWPDNVRYIEVTDPKPSPASALNLGVRLARGEYVCPVIDGARMASPGLLYYGLLACEARRNAFVATIGMHLGFERQSIAVPKGYNQETEDALLESIDWMNNGYQLFDISCPGGSSPRIWFDKIAESNAPILSKRLFDELGGFDERFDLPGGGLVNLDFFKRAVQRERSTYFMLLGEATFHQHHGGVTTSKSISEAQPDGKSEWDHYDEQYERIRNERFATPEERPVLIGHLSGPAQSLVRRYFQSDERGLPD